MYTSILLRAGSLLLFEIQFRCCLAVKFFSIESALLDSAAPTLQCRLLFLPFPLIRLLVSQRQYIHLYIGF